MREGSFYILRLLQVFFLLVYILAPTRILSFGHIWILVWSRILKISQICLVARHEQEQLECILKLMLCNN